MSIYTLSIDNINRINDLLRDNMYNNTATVCKNQNILQVKVGNVESIIRDNLNIKNTERSTISSRLTLKKYI